jgi:hypothetical protein
VIRSCPKPASGAGLKIYLVGFRVTVHYDLPKGSEGNYNNARSDAWSIDPGQSDWEKVDFRGGE